MVQIIKFHFKLGETGAADSALQRLLTLEAEDTRLRKEVARIYHDGGMDEKAIRILAGILQEEPENKEILELIDKYQEE